MTYKWYDWPTSGQDLNEVCWHVHMDPDGQMCVYYTCEIWYEWYCQQIYYLTVTWIWKKPAASVWPCGEHITRNARIARIMISQCSNTLKPFDTNVSDDIACVTLTASFPINGVHTPPLLACCWAGRIFAFAATLWTSKHEEAILPDSAGAYLYLV